MSEKKFEKHLSLFQKFLSIIKGQTDLRSRIAILLQPAHPETSSNLSLGQTEYVRDALWIADVYPEFAPMRKDAIQMALANLSKDGWAVSKTIDLQRSLTEKTLEKTMLKEVEKTTTEGGD